ncbi:MAG: hypothetical protein R3D90_11785 [Paracoccaceae bacterium]
MRLIPALLAPLALVACAQPGFLKADAPAVPPPLLPIEDILAAESPALDAEAAAALAARGDALRGRAGTPG